MARHPRAGKAGRAARSQNALRLTGGDWRGRRLDFPLLPGLRPTLSQGRERLFNWLQFDLAGRRVLDAFAGSGVLGLEALSRRAAEVVFLEQERQAATAIREHLQRLDALARGRVYCVDALGWLQQAEQPFDVVFLDPPFSADLFQHSLQALAASRAVAPGTLVYLETPRTFTPTLPTGWHMHREARSGSLFQRLLRVERTESGG